MKKIIATILSVLMLLACFAGCQAAPAETQAAGAVATGVEDGILTVGMECAYAPYNWSQTSAEGGAVQIAGSKEFAY